MGIDAQVIGILRGIDGDFFEEVMQLSFVAGLPAIEITMNTPHAERIVAQCRPAVPAGRMLGMGTIRDRHEAERAVGAGAMFLVTPNLDTQVIEYANGEGIPVVAGAFTPTEVYTAWRAGADMVKVFPCGALGGPTYIRHLRGPFDRVKFCAVGGVSVGNLADYFVAGAAAVGVGQSLFGGRALRELDLHQVGLNVRNFMEKSRNAMAEAVEGNFLPGNC